MIHLGDEVKDTITGFKGIAVSRHEYLQGCTRYTVQPKTVKNVLPKPMGFDEPDLIVIKEKNAKRKNSLGGPEKYKDTEKV